MGQKKIACGFYLQAHDFSWDGNLIAPENVAQSSFTHPLHCECVWQVDLVWHCEWFSFCGSRRVTQTVSLRDEVAKSTNAREQFLLDLLRNMSTSHWLFLVSNHSDLSSWKCVCPLARTLMEKTSQIGFEWNLKPIDVKDFGHTDPFNVFVSNPWGSWTSSFIRILF